MTNSTTEARINSKLGNVTRTFLSDLEVPQATLATTLNPWPWLPLTTLLL